jgi:signal peptidase I
MEGNPGGDRPNPLAGAICPNCLFEYAKSPRSGLKYSDNGDRVLVLKYLYRLGSLAGGEPKRWDVVVFRNPQTNHENFIKRLIGLPGETIEIVHGDIFVKNPQTGEMEIRRKTPQAQEAMWQVVFDNDYQPDPQRVSDGSSPHWNSQDEASWKTGGDHGRIFEFAGGPAREVTFTPATSLPRMVRPPTPIENATFLPRYGYNSANNLDSRQMTSVDELLDVCSDLKLSFIYTPKADSSGVSLMLSAFDDFFKAKVDASGNVTLWRSHGAKDAKEEELGKPAQIGALAAGRGYRIEFAHVDLELQVAVDGKIVLRNDDGENYKSIKERLGQALSDEKALPTPQVAIGATGGPCELRHVSLMRDEYYTSPGFGANRANFQFDSEEAGPLGNLARQDDLRRKRPWAVTDNPITLKHHPENTALDEFFVLGDNSPNSSDGRLWWKASPTLQLDQYHMGTVPRYSMLGKAFFVYWPAGFRVPGLPQLPLVPNVGDMRFIR